MKKPRIAGMCPGPIIKIFYLLVLAVVFITAIFVGSAQAVNYYVSTTGNDGNLGTTWATAFRSLQRAANAATAAGDVITVADGTYSYWDNSALCNTARALAGDNYMAVCILFYSGVTLRAQNRGLARVIGSNESFGGNVCAGIQIWGGAPFDQGDNITIDGFEIDGRDGGGFMRIQDGICLNTRASNNIIQYNNVHNCSRNGIAVGKTIGGGGDYDSHGYCNFNAVRYNNCYSISTAGFYEYASAGNTVEYNLFRDNMSYGIEIYARTAITNQSVYRYNICYSNDYGLNIDYKNEVGTGANPTTAGWNADTRVEYCTFANNSNGVRAGAAYLLLYYNIIAFNISYGVNESDNGWWDGCTDIKGDYNCVYNNNIDYISNSFPPTGDNIHAVDGFFDINVDPQFLTTGTAVWATSYQLRNKYSPTRVDTGQGLTSPCIDRSPDPEVAPDLRGDLGAHRNLVTSSVNYIGYPDPPANLSPNSVLTWFNSQWIFPISMNLSDPIVPPNLETLNSLYEVSYEKSFASGGNIVSTVGSGTYVNPFNFITNSAMLPYEGQYHWRAYCKDNRMNISSWTVANNDNIAFGVDITRPNIVDTLTSSAQLSGIFTIDLAWPVTEDQLCTLKPATPAPVGYSRESGRLHYNVYRSTFTYVGTSYQNTYATRMNFLNTCCDLLSQSNLQTMSDNISVPNSEIGGTYYYTVNVVDRAGNMGDLMNPMLRCDLPQIAWHNPAVQVPGILTTYRYPVNPSGFDSVSLQLGTAGEAYSNDPADYAITMYWAVNSSPTVTSPTINLSYDHTYNPGLGVFKQYYYKTDADIPAQAPGTTVNYMFKITLAGFPGTYWLLEDGLYEGVNPPDPTDPARIYYHYYISELYWHEPSVPVPGAAISTTTYRDPSVPTNFTTVDIWAGVAGNGNVGDYDLTMYYAVNDTPTAASSSTILSYVHTSTSAPTGYYYKTTSPIPNYGVGDVVRYMFKLTSAGLPGTYWLFDGGLDQNSSFPVLPPVGKDYFEYTILIDPAAGFLLEYSLDTVAKMPLVSGSGSLDLDKGTGTTITNTAHNSDPAYNITNLDTVRHYAKIRRINPATPSEIRFYYTVGTHSNNIITNVDDLDPLKQNYFINGTYDKEESGYALYYADFPSDIHACGDAAFSMWASSNGVVGVRISGRSDATLNAWITEDNPLQSIYSYYVRKDAGKAAHPGEVDGDVRAYPLLHWPTTRLALKPLDSRYYFMPEGTAVDNFTLDANFRTVAGMGNKWDMIFGDIPDVYLRFAYADGDATGGAAYQLIYATGTNYPACAWDVCGSTESVVDDQANDGLVASGFANDYYGHFGMVKFDHASAAADMQGIGESGPESGNLQYYFRIKDGSVKYFLYDLDGSGAMGWTTTEDTAKADPFTYTILQDDLSRPRAVTHPENGQNGVWASPGTWSRGGTYTVRINIEDIRANNNDIYGNTGFGNLIAGRGKDSGVYGINSTGYPPATTSVPVHTTRLYYRFANAAETVGANQYCSNVDFITAVACGDAVDSPNTAFVDMVGPGGATGNGLWQGSFTLGSQGQFIYYRVYACNNDADPQAHVVTSTNTYTNVGGAAAVGVHGTTGAVIANPATPANRELDRDHGWIMPTRFGGTVTGERMIRIISEADVNGTKKIVVTDVSAEDSKPGNIISHEITNKAP